MNGRQGHSGLRQAEIIMALSLATTSAADEIRGGVLSVYQSATSLGIILGSALAGVLFGIARTVPYVVGGTLFVLMLLPGFPLLRYGRREAAWIEP